MLDDSTSLSLAIGTKQSKAHSFDIYFTPIAILFSNSMILILNLILQMHIAFYLLNRFFHAAMQSPMDYISYRLQYAETQR